MGRDHSGPASRPVPCFRGRCERHALPLSPMGTPCGVCSSPRKKCFVFLLAHDPPPFSVKWQGDDASVDTALCDWVQGIAMNEGRQRWHELLRAWSVEH